MSQRRRAAFWGWHSRLPSDLHMHVHTCVSTHIYMSMHTHTHKKSKCRINTFWMKSHEFPLVSQVVYKVYCVRKHPLCGDTAMQNRSCWLVLCMQRAVQCPGQTASQPAPQPLFIFSLSPGSSVCKTGATTVHSVKEQQLLRTLHSGYCTGTGRLADGESEGQTIRKQNK